MKPGATIHSIPVAAKPMRRENMVYRLYGASTGNCFRAAIALEEVGIEYVASRLDLRNGDNKSEEFLSLNPAGTVPVLIGTDEWLSSAVLTQSNAIMMFADAMKPGHLLPRDANARVWVMERFFYVLTEAIAPNFAAFSLRRQGQSDGAEILSDRSLRAIAAMEAFVQSMPYLAGEMFSLADIAGYVIMRASLSDLEASKIPRLRKWFDRMAERPAFQRGIAAFA